MAVRTTKKWVRDQKTGFIHRMNEIKKMDETQLRAEVKRCFPGMEVTGGTERELLTYMVMDLIELTFPEQALA